ncbi:MAG: ABC transporter permease [Gemmatimonadota bacterium]|jgi:predicted permease
MDTLLRDLRFGAKLLWRDKAFSLTVVFTLALCVGANVAIFGVVDAVLLEPLPYAGADRLVTVFNSYPGAGAERGSNGTVDFFQRRENVPAFEEVAVYQGAGVVVGQAGSIDRVTGMRVTPSFFPLLGVEAALGRTFGEEQMEPGGGTEVVLSRAEWEERLGGSPDAVGSTLRIDGRPHTVVGVLPGDFRVAGREDARLFLPVVFREDARDMDNWHSNDYGMMARLRPGATIAQAQAQIDALNEALIDRWPIPNARQLLTDAGFNTRVVDARADLVRDVRPVLYLLWAGVVFVLLIGCVNVANLVASRSQARLTELATRVSLGAERATLVRQLLTESLVIAVVGTAVGVGLGRVGIDLISGLGADRLPRGADVSVGPEVLGFAGLLALLAAAVIGIVPAVQVLREDLGSVFRSESRSGTANRRTVLLRGALVSGQVALAFLLLSGASLMFLSFRAAVAVDPGFEPEGVVAGYFSMPGARYPDDDAHIRFVDELLPAVRAVPGVETAALTTMLPFSGNNSSSVIVPEGYVPKPGESVLSPLQSWVTPGYFEAMGIDVLEGRPFGEVDGEPQPNVIIIDEWLARRYWPDSSPLGQRMLWGAVPGMEDIPEDRYATVVGVVGTVKQNDLTASEHVGAYYFPYAQNPGRSYLTLVVKRRPGTDALGAPLREVFAALDPEMPLYDLRPLGERIDESLTARRAPMLLLGIFAGVALLLAFVGLYGSLAYTVSQRTREMGIRMAIGSSPEGIFRLVVGQGMRMTLVGLVVGVGGAFVLARLMESLLFGVRSGDPGVMSAVALALVLVAGVASAVPAWRATRMAPTDALNRQ